MSQLVTKITPTKKEGRFSIFLNNKFAFAVGEYIVSKYKLKEGKALPSKLIQEIVFEENLEYLKTRALDFISRRPRSEKEVIDNLKLKLSRRMGNLKLQNDKLSFPRRRESLNSTNTRSPTESEMKTDANYLNKTNFSSHPEGSSSAGVSKNLEIELINSVLEFLKKYDYIDDKAFANWLVEQRVNQNKGPLYIQQDLFKKGVSKEVAKEALAAIDYSSSINIAYKKALQKYKKEPDEYKRKQKIYNYLLRQGFSYEDIQNVID